MAVVAVQSIRRMRGGAQSQLMLGADKRLWVVKFQNNPQHLRVLANELIATRLAEAVGLTVPATDIVDVAELLIANTPGMVMELPRGATEPCRPGLQFGSAFIGGLMPGQVVDYLPEPQLEWRDVRGPQANSFTGQAEVAHRLLPVSPTQPIPEGAPSVEGRHGAAGGRRFGNRGPPAPG